MFFIFTLYNDRADYANFCANPSNPALSKREWRSWLRDRRDGSNVNAQDWRTWNNPLQEIPSSDQQSRDWPELFPFWVTLTIIGILAFAGLRGLTPLSAEEQRIADIAQANIAAMRSIAPAIAIPTRNPRFHNVPN